MSRRLMLKALAAVIVSAAIAPAMARAQQGGPVVILTAKSAGEVIGDLRYLATALAPPGDPRAADAAQALDALKDPAALKGLDPARPLGAYASLPEGGQGDPTAVAFVPVLDAKAFLAALEGFGATVEADAGAPGFSHKVTLPGGNIPPLFVVDAGKYLFFSITPAGADALKALKPETLLPARPGAGDLSLTLRLDRVPQAIKDTFNAQLEQNLIPQRERQPGEDDAALKARLTGMKLTQDAFVALVRDGKELALDIVIDPKAESVGLELNSSAVAGSPYAASLKTMAALKSKFRGLAGDSAVGGFVAIPLAQGIRDVMSMGIDKGKAEALEKAKNDPAQQKLLNDLVDALRPTMTADTLDMAFSIQGPFPSKSGGDPTYVMASAMAVKDGKKLEAALREGIKTAPDDQKKGLTLDAFKATDGTSVHKMTGLSEDKDPGPLGEATAYAAFRDDVAAFAVGKNGQAVMDQILSVSKAPAAGAAPQMEMLVSASRVGGLAQTAEERKTTTAAVAETFVGPSAKKDKIRATLQASGDTLTLRLAADSPALKFLARLAQARNAEGK